MFLGFDEVGITRRVSALPWNQALAFGCSCAERLMWSYRWFAEQSSIGEVKPLGRALNVLWDASRTIKCPSAIDCRQLLSDCEAQTPSSEVYESLLTTSAQEAALAVCSLLDYCIDRKIEHVIMAARYPTDSVDLYIQEIEHLSPLDPELEHRILSHPLMQQELARQHRDLTMMELGGDKNVEELYFRRTKEASLKQGLAFL